MNTYARIGGSTLMFVVSLLGGIKVPERHVDLHEDQASTVNHNLPYKMSRILKND